MFRHHHHPLMAAAGDPPAGGGAETVEVDLPGVGKIALPKEQAAQVIKARDHLKEQARAASEKLGAAEAEKQAAAESARKAAEAQALAEATKKGEIDKVAQIHADKLKRLAERVRNDRFRAVVASNPQIVPTAVGDVVSQLCQSCQYDPETDHMTVVGADGSPLKAADGKPVTLEAHLAAFLAERPHFCKASTTPGSGGEGGKQGGGSGPSVTAAALEAMSPRERAEHFAKGGTVLKT